MPTHLHDKKPIEVEIEQLKQNQSSVEEIVSGLQKLTIKVGNTTKRLITKGTLLAVASSVAVSGVGSTLVITRYKCDINVWANSQYSVSVAQECIKPDLAEINQKIDNLQQPNITYIQNSTTPFQEAVKAAQGEQGIAGPIGQTGNQGISGAAGVSGKQGIAGDKGEQGITGPKGDKGETGTEGKQGVAGLSGSSGFQGATGPQGLQGVAGTSANVGATGAQGEQGIIGLTGATGLQGIKGDTGAAGIQGLTGLTGATGANGAQGIQGLKGDMGAVGATGAQGVQGIIGFTGAQGIQGLTGAQGIQGLKGDKGDTGDQGIQGIQGIQGLVGAIGAAGIQGIQGLVGAVGDQGIQGIRGLTGATGLTGSQGLKGDTGATGSQGIQGLKGDTGDQGIQGIQGIQGLIGATGLQGIKGDKGDTGATGLTGVVGAIGAAGIQGIQGIQGLVGAVGDQGIQGMQGLQGLKGDKGDTGEQGIQGLTGAVGPQGLKGDTGNTGAIGAQGIQGLTGETGAQGIQGIQGIQGLVGADGIANIQTASNGLTLTGSNLTLGGLLNSPTVITTDSSNTLTISGLENGLASDRFLVQDASGVLKTTTLTASPITAQNGSTLLSSGISFIPTTSATNSIFLGYAAGHNADQSNFSNFIGAYAGYGNQFNNGTATNAKNSNFFGSLAGYGAANANNSIFIGDNAGFDDTVVNNGNGFGSDTSILIGNYTSTRGFSNSIALGAGAVNTKANQFTIAPAYNNLSIGGIEYVVPNAQATAPRQVLTNDGTGTLSWQLSGGGSPNLYYNESIDSPLVNPVNSAFQSVVIGSGSTVEGTNSYIIGRENSITFNSASRDNNYIFGNNNSTNGSNVTLIGSNLSDTLNDSIEIGTSNLTKLTLAPDGGLTLRGALMPDGFGGFVGQVLTSQGQGAVPLWQTLTPSPLTVVNSNSLFTTGIANPAGLGATSVVESIFFGANAGSGATSANNSNFFGQNAGTDATNANISNFFGISTGQNATNASRSNFFGNFAGYGATNASNSTFVGNGTGQNATNATLSTFVGELAGIDATNANNSLFLGRQAGNLATNAALSTFIGEFAGNDAPNANNSIFVGNRAGLRDLVNNSTGSTSILIGNNTNTGGFSNSIALGTGAINTKSNQFKIATAYNNLSIGGVDYIVPNAQAIAPGQVLTNNGSGGLSWASTASNRYYLESTGAPAINPLNSASQSVVIGSGSVVEGSRSYIIGRENVITSNSASRDNNYILGNNNSINGNNTYTLGANLTGAIAGNNSVQIGTSNSTKLVLDSSGGLNFQGALQPNFSPGLIGQILTSQGSGVAPIWSTPVSAATASNGLTLTGSSNVTLGGPMTQNTTIDGTATNNYALTLTNSNLNLSRTNTAGTAGVISIGPTRFIASDSNALLSCSGPYRFCPINANLFIGQGSGKTNLQGGKNTALGFESLFSINSGSFNNALGASSLFSNISGNQNVGIGFGALYDNISGSNNVAIGRIAGNGLTTGNSNVAIGDAAGFANSTGSNQLSISNIIFGTGLTGSVGTPAGLIGIGIASPTNKLTVEDPTTTNVARFNGSASTQCTVVTGTGLSCSSDRRLKQGIAAMGNSTDIIESLKPVTYQWNGGSDTQYGLIAQDVQAVLPDLVTTNSDGYLSLSQQELMPFVIKALQETNAKVKANSQATSVATTTNTFTQPNIFNQTVTAIGGLVAQSISYLQELVVRGLAVFKGPVVFEDVDMSGQVTIGAGQNTAFIAYSKPNTEAPVITVSGLGHGKLGYILASSPIGFTIKVDQVSNIDLKFNWVAIRNGRDNSLELSSQTNTSQSSPLPTSSVISSQITNNSSLLTSSALSQITNTSDPSQTSSSTQASSVTDLN
jgi:Chaperone of endosialidase/Collagen triple helix repeat (20 copies)